MMAMVQVEGTRITTWEAEWLEHLTTSQTTSSSVKELTTKSSDGDKFSVYTHH